MLAKIGLLSDQTVRHAIGLRFEAFVDEAFQVVRWSAIVGLAQFLAARRPGPLFDLLYWLLAALLFGYLSSRFLLRPEIRLFSNDAPGWQRLMQSAVNFMLCVVVFLALLWGIAAVTSGIAEYRFLR